MRALLIVCCLAATSFAEVPAAEVPAAGVPAAELPSPDAEVARRHYDTGLSLYGAQRYREAIVEFEAARQLYASSAFDYNIARCHERLGAWGAAADAYEAFLVAEPEAKDAGSLRERIRTLRARTTPLSRRDQAGPGGLRVGAAVVGALALGSFVAATGLVASVATEFPDLRQSCAGQCAPDRWAGLEARAHAGYALWGIAGAAAVVDVALWVLDVRRRRALGTRPMADRGWATPVRF